MPDLRIFPDAEEGGMLADVDREKLVEAKMVAVGGLRSGTVQGNPTVFVQIELPDGTPVVAETTLALFDGANRAITARMGTPGGSAN